MLALAVAAGAAALVPAGVGAGTTPNPHDPASVDTRCTDAKELVSVERELLAGRFAQPGAERQYDTLLGKLSSDACKPQKECSYQQGDVATMVEARAGLLDAAGEATLAAAEQDFLRKHCSS
ncbi:MAG: hypothetical protein ACRD0S_04285 [Acidimicrobiales bacterium]